MRFAGNAVRIRRPLTLKNFCFNESMFRQLSYIGTRNRLSEDLISNTWRYVSRRSIVPVVSFLCGSAFERIVMGFRSVYLLFIKGNCIGEIYFKGLGNSSRLARRKRTIRTGPALRGRNSKAGKIYPQFCGSRDILIFYGYVGIFKFIIRNIYAKKYVIGIISRNEKCGQ